MDIWGPPTETVVLRATWTVWAKDEGQYNVSVLATSNLSDVDPNRAGAWCEVQVMRDAPNIGELLFSPVYSSPDLDPEVLFVYPRQGFEVKCNVTCRVSIENVTLLYSVKGSGVWNQLEMRNEEGKVFSATISGQPEGNELQFHVMAFASAGKSARTRDYACTVADLQALDFRAETAIATTVGVILACSLVFLAFRRRRLAELS
jgi:hypothetical protein